MSIHAGGIVWAGPYLHIAATSRGFVTARVDDIMRVPGDDDHPDKFGLEGTTLYSFGHRYVLPVRFTYQAYTDKGHDKLRYSFLSLDRRSDPPALIAGEYAVDPTPPPGWPATRSTRRRGSSPPATTGSPGRWRSTTAGCGRCRGR